MRRAVPAAALALLALALPAAGDAPDPVHTGDAIAIKIDELPSAFRLWTPRYLYENEAEFTAWVPPGMADRAYRLVVTGPDGKTVTDKALDLEPPGGKRKPKVHTARVTLDAAAWKDGAYTATLVPRGDDEGADGAAPEPAAEGRFRVVRDEVRAHWRGDLRDELALWLEHANRPRDIWKKIPRWQALDEAMATPEKLYGGLRGLVLRSYANPHLGRRIPYAAYVPEAYDPGEPMPLLILLHGSGGNYVNVVSDMYHGQELETHPMLVANAGAFRHQEYRHMALNDVVWVLEDMARKYAVDRDRVYVQGISLGGRGAIELAALRPELFAAVSPQGVYGLMQEPDDIPDFLWHEPYARWSVARWDLRSLLPNVRHVPMQIIYGYHDTTCPPLHALTVRHLVNKRFGGRAEAVGFDAGHDITWPVYKWSETRAWLLEHRRVAVPPVVTARTASLRFNQFYWVTIGWMETYWQMASVEARQDGDAVDVRARNVAWLALDPPQPCRKLTVNGTAVDLGTRQGEEIVVAGQPDGTWHRLVGRLDDDPRFKRHGVSGPIWDVLHGPCLAVYGTGGSAEETANLERLARGVAALDLAWGEPSWPVVADTELDEAARAAHNLMLVGDARTNALLKGRDWPFDLRQVGRGQGIEVFGETYDRPGDVLMFIYPSPFAEGRYVYVVAAAVSAEAPRALNPATNWDVGVWSDWLVRRYGEDHAGHGRRGSAVDGVFNAQWKLEKMPGRLLPARPMNWE